MSMMMKTEVEAPVVPDVLALWAGREEFLNWCRERGVKGRLVSAPYACLVANAISIVARRDLMCGNLTIVDYEGNQLGILPVWLTKVVKDFDCQRLPEFTEPVRELP